jgi:FixJ family two-component response regulator
LKDENNIARNTKMTKLPLISVVDDDESVRESLPDLLRELGYEARAFSSAVEFLRSVDLHRTECLILDIAMPEMTGPELQKELQFRGHKIPIIFITAHADKKTRPRMMNNGAIECLSKPFSEAALINALNVALKMP